jgi:hypothetical protein
MAVNCSADGKLDMDLGELKSRLQRHLGDGLVTIIGSGLSCSEGMPGMSAIADHLKVQIPDKISSGDEEAWKAIQADIEPLGLEAALLKTQPSPTLEALIVAEVTALLLPVEKGIIEEAITGERTLALTSLLSNMLKPNSGIPIITTNYDRLIEFAAEQAGLGVDTMFVGNYCGSLNAAESQFSFLRDAKLRGKNVHYHYQKRIKLFKPHGSFDWFLANSGPIRCGGELTLPRHIITPV